MRNYFTDLRDILEKDGYSVEMVRSYNGEYMEYYIRRKPYKFSTLFNARPDDIERIVRKYEYYKIIIEYQLLQSNVFIMND